MPEFKEHENARMARKADELAPYIEKAMARKVRMKELTDDEIPTILALGRQITERDASAREAQKIAEEVAKAGE